MKARSMSVYFLFFLGIIIPIAGCAVLKIDIDIYKGPLSNHDDVQIEQLAAIAMGTKQLLVQLRNELEIREIKKDSNLSKNQEEIRIEAIKYNRDWINTDICKPTDPCKLTSTLALNINDILSLYKDKTETDGRRDDGIEKCIEKYINDINDKSETNRNILIDELVRFAEKVLIVANNDQLFQKGKLFALTNIKDYFLEDVVGFQINSYVLVLQAIGNSILTQADELQHKATYKEKIKDPGANNNELWAMKQATTRQPREVLDTIIKEVQALGKTAMAEMDNIKKQLEDFGAPKTKGTENEFDDFYVTSTKVFEYVTREKTEYDNNCGTWTKAYDLLQEKNLTGKLEEEGREPFFEILKRDVLSSNGTITMNNFLKAITRKLDEEIRNENQVVASESERDDVKSRVAYLDDVRNYLSEPKGDIAKFSKNVDNNTPKNLYYDQLYGKFFTDLSTKKYKSEINYNKARKVKEIADKYLKEKDEKVKFNHAEDKISEVKSEVLAKFNITEERPTSETVIWHLKDVLHEKIEAAKGTEKKPYEHAIEFVKDRQSTLEDMKIVDNTDAKNTKDVFDQMIALLKHRHIQAVKDAGADSASAKYCDEALQLAYSYRSNMVYIRPPSAYLRNSYPSTSLQSDPGLTWKNMLGEQAQRSMPFYRFGHDLKPKEKITAEIDKQYWQNINSVRVAGAGRTNYVIAKDDVGNWYVKRYSSDPQDIIKSAQKLALFNLNPMMKTDLVGRLSSKIDQEKVQQQDQYNAQDGENKAPEVTEKKTEANRTTLEQIFDKYQNEYTEQTKNDYEKLRGILNKKTDVNEKEPKSSIEDDIENAWKKNTDTNNFIGTLTANMDNAAIYLVNARKELPEKPEEEKEKKGRATRIVDALREIKRFHTVLISDIRDLKLTENPTKNLAEKKEAKKTADKELQETEEDLPKKKTLVESAQSYYDNQVKIEGDLKLDWVRKTTLYEGYPENTDEEKKEKQNRKDEMDTAKVTHDKAEIDVVNAKTKLDNANNAYTQATEQFKQRQAAVSSAEQGVKTAQDELDSAVRAGKFAIQSTTNIVRNVLMDILEKRTDVVKDYETGIMFIGDAIKENN